MRPLNQHHKDVIKRASKRGHRFAQRALRAIIKRRGLVNSAGYYMYR